jgi:hypothetical protein
VIEVFMAFMKPGWFRDESKGWPDVFVREVAENAWEGCRRRRSFADVKDEWMKKLEEAEEDEIVEVSNGDGETDAARHAKSTKGLIDEYLHGRLREPKRKTSARRTIAGPC